MDADRMRPLTAREGEQVVGRAVPEVSTAPQTAQELMQAPGPDGGYHGKGGVASCIEFAERVGTSLPAGNPGRAILAEVAAAKAELEWLRARAALAERMEDDGRRRG